MREKNYKDFAVLDLEQVFGELESQASGLIANQVKNKLVSEGKNVIPRKKKGILPLFFHQFRNWFIFLLILASIISFILGETRQVLTILLILGLTGTLGFIQEFYYQRTVEKLQEFISAKVWVRRDGELEEIDKEDLVTGDILILEKGDVVPADTRVSEAKGLLVDEAILTGESRPIEKVSLKLLTLPKSIIEAKNIIFAGTIIVEGSGEGIVVKKGAGMEVSKIAQLTERTYAPSAFEQDIKKISNFIMKLVIVTLALVFGGNILLKGMGINIPELLLFVSALAIGIVPEALPVVALVTLSVGALMMAKKKVVVKRLSAIDEFGNIEVLCVDKTGTITQNILQVDRIFAEDEKNFWRIFLAAVEPIKGKKGKIKSLFDKALLEEAKKETRESVWTCLFKIPFDASLRRDVIVVKNNKEVLMITKGAPEEILKLSKLSEKERKIFEKQFQDEGGAGKRVYALAAKEVDEEADFLTESKKNDFCFYGLASFSDSIKPTAKLALQKANKLGVSVRILTGDTPQLALKIAQEIDLAGPDDRVVSGFELERLNQNQIKRLVLETKIFARVTPEQKFQIISILREKFSVGFLGDGANDAPALKVANVGIAVDSAADITKEAADIVLLKKDLEVIVDGIEEGRKTFANIMKYIKYTLASNFGNCYALAIASLFSPFLPLLPAQILLVNLLSDFPLISVAVDSVDEREVLTPQKLDLKPMATLIVLLGMISSLFDFTVFAFFRGFGEGILQTVWFTESILSEIVFVFSIRTRFFFLKAKRPAKLLLAVSTLTALITLVIPFTPLKDIFFFSRPKIWMIFAILAIVFAYFVITEMVKLWYFKVLDRKK